MSDEVKRKNLIVNKSRVNIYHLKQFQIQLKVQCKMGYYLAKRHFITVPVLSRSLSLHFQHSTHITLVNTSSVINLLLRAQKEASLGGRVYRFNW
jgi:hypothetical protein